MSSAARRSGDDACARRRQWRSTVREEHRPPPPTGEHPPPAGEHPPRTGEHPPPTGEHPPPTGEHPPPTGEHSPPTGEHPPPTGEHPPPTREHPSPIDSQRPAEPQSADDGNVGAQPSGDIHSRLTALRLNLARYQQLRSDRLSRLTSDIRATQNLLACQTAEVKSVQRREEGEEAIREAISWIEVEVSNPMRLERHEELGEILSDLEDQCERCCEMYDGVPHGVSGSISPRSGAATLPSGKQVTITVTPPDGSTLSRSPPDGSRFSRSPPGGGQVMAAQSDSNDVSPVDGSNSAPALMNGVSSSISPTRTAFPLDGRSSSKSRSPSGVSSSSGGTLTLDGSSSPTAQLTPTRRSLIRSLTLACSRRLHRSGSLPARLPKAAIPAPLPALVRPRFFLRFSTDGSSGGGARVVVETRSDVAPRLARLFAAGCGGPYRGSAVLRCVPGWWLQAGPIDTAAVVCPRLADSHAPRLETRPGAVELLSARLGADEDSGEAGGGGWLVGPQFFIHLRSYSFTAVLGYVVEGLEQAARLASSGDPRAGYAPRRPISIVQCGQL